MNPCDACEECADCGENSVFKVVSFTTYGEPEYGCSDSFNLSLDGHCLWHIPIVEGERWSTRKRKEDAALTARIKGEVLHRKIMSEGMFIIELKV